MPNLQIDALFQLIKSLTKSEKRNFKLYVNRIHSKEDVKFIQLFDVLDKMTVYDEGVLLEKAKGIKKRQLSNLKRHLYRQLLTSLRLVHISKNIDIEIREQIDYAKILYNKGLYLQSLKLLDKTKTIAKERHQDILHFEIIEFEKLIESRHITRSIENRAEALSGESDRRNEVISLTARLANLGLRLYGLYIKLGHVRNEKDAYMVREFFRSNCPKLPENKLTFFEKIHLYQAYVWYYYILQDFRLCYRYAQKWVDLFEEFPNMKIHDPDFYMRGMNNLLACLFFIKYHSKLKQNLLKLEAFCTESAASFNPNSEILAFLYIYTARINLHFLEGSFTTALKLIPELNAELDRFKSELDQHRVMVFYYKIACIYFASGDNENAIVYLSKIINLDAGHLREDIQCYARLLHLIAHYELGHYNLLEYLVKSVYRFLVKMKDLNAIQTEILTFLRNTIYKSPMALKKDFIKLKARLVKISEDPYERRSFLYLDIISWLESKIEERSVETIIQEKAGITIR